ncbi:cytochrome-c peroxidase [Thermosulfuriphilus sp.]
MFITLLMALFLFLSSITALWAQPPLGLPPVPVPEDNPMSPAKVALGKALFEDVRFSADKSISCATCHKPERVFVDGLPVAKGIKGLLGTRNTPTVVNAVYYDTQFWDGRRKTLEEQAKDPLINPVEHGLTSHLQVVEVVRQDPDYLRQFKEVFGVEPQEITIDHVAKAIAAFERTVISGNSPFDRYLYGGDETALSAAAKRGFEIFKGKGRCQSCHTIGEEYAIFTDNKFHNLGVGFQKIAPRLREIVNEYRRLKLSGASLDEVVLDKVEISELGRFAVTLNLSDLGAFKTPTLRNVAVTGSYMHDGSLETLEEVIELYNQGGEKNPFLASGIRPLNLTEQEKADLVEFLKSLTSPEYEHLLKD